MDRYERLFVVTSFLLQVILLVYFGYRKWNFDLSMRWGWIVYAMAIPALAVSLALMRAGKPWSLWLGGCLYTLWAIFGFMVDIAHPINWRSPVYLPVFIPYVALYMAALMFYWWPLATIRKVYWYVYTVLFVASTYLNLSSHGK